ncbi:MAG: hypothetical protein K0R03_2657 [Moraxellaceae bacterium]|jgi:YD repeat-containing protein|nr:hypothetical protein [Moraxellaceae bacterium]
MLGLALLAGCNGNDSPSQSRLVAVESYNPESGEPTGSVRVTYATDGGAEVTPYTSAGVPVENGFRMQCRFEAASVPAYPAVSRRNLINGISGSLTGKILLSILGLPTTPVRGCQEYFPDLAVLEERMTSPVLEAESLVGERVEVTRTEDGRLTQRHSGRLGELLLASSGFVTYDEDVRYVSSEGHATGMIYGAEAWPEGSYVDYSDGNIVIDLFLLGALDGLVAAADGLRVSPAAGYAQSYAYDESGRLASIRGYDGRGEDGQWLTNDDVPEEGGLARYSYASGRLASVETGLNPADGEPTELYRIQRFAYADGLLHEKRVYDAGERLLEVWKYAH